MKMLEFLRHNFIYRSRQFGLKTALFQLARAAMRPLFEVKEDLVFIIPDFKGYDFFDPRVHILNAECIDELLARGNISQSDARLFQEFLKEGSLGLFVEIDGKMAGYAWLQLYGEYKFAGGCRMTIPDNHVIFKNLFVYPKFRGQKIGQVLNQARLQMVTAGMIPTVFIIPENRIAIRNWEKFGFKRVLKLRHWRLLSSVWHLDIRRLADVAAAVILERALTAGHKKAHRTENASFHNGRQ